MMSSKRGAAQTRKLKHRCCRVIRITLRLYVTIIRLRLYTRVWTIGPARLRKVYQVLFHRRCFQFSNITSALSERSRTETRIFQPVFGQNWNDCFRALSKMVWGELDKHTLLTLFVHSLVCNNKNVVFSVNSYQNLCVRATRVFSHFCLKDKFDIKNNLQVNNFSIVGS